MSAQRTLVERALDLKERGEPRQAERLLRRAVDEGDITALTELAFVLLDLTEGWPASAVH
jgi:hypothetical protein